MEEAASTVTAAEAVVVPKATESSTSSTALRKLVGSLALTAEAWLAVKAVRACACCAARLAGCRESAVYDCDERDLKAELDARFSENGRCPPTSPVVATGEPDSALAGSSSGSTVTREKCCTLCLGLLQFKVLLRMAPRARPSSESHQDNMRSCVAEARSPRTPSSDASTSNNPRAATRQGGPGCTDLPQPEHEVVLPLSTEETVANGCTASAAGPISEIASSIPDKPTATAEITMAPSSSDCAATTTATSDDCAYRRARMAEAIAECSVARGYTVSSFGVTAAVPACLAVHDAAFLEARGGDLSPIASSSCQSVTGTDTAPATVTVKEALKLGLIGGLQVCLGGAKFDADSDFVVEVTAKAPEADAHAMTTLLGGPELSQSGAKKPGWPGSGRWAKKRQRREEHRNPGLTIGAVKKGLAVLDDEGRERMRRWVDGLSIATAREIAKGPQREGNDTEAEGGGRTRAGGDRHEEIGEETKEGMGVGSQSRDIADGMEVEANPQAHGAKGTTRSSNANDSAGSVDAAAASKTACTPPAPRPNTDGMAACCDITIRRQPIHFWGRYTKLSRTVPQTPWIKGFYSVQEAVSEPFEAFSGCVEGQLHGAGREDVDVRMLGNGRPFSLELVDSLRSVDEIGARLASLADAINSGAGRKNAGGGVAVSKLRVAGPDELPCDVQKVGEGKRKHYRCVVWVSRAVGREEVRAMCDRPELVVQQSTPVRVLHRRTLMDRPRLIFDMRAEWINEHFFVLDLTTSAGGWRHVRLLIATGFFVLFQIPMLLAFVLFLTYCAGRKMNAM